MNLHWLRKRCKQGAIFACFFPSSTVNLMPVNDVGATPKNTRAYANGSITRLRKIVPEGLDSCNPDLIKKFFRTCRDYCKAYRGGYTCRNVDTAVKVYKSHRRIFNTEQ